MESIKLDSVLMTAKATGIGTTNTTYAAKTRRDNGTPTLKCTNNNDKFTKSTTIGNGKLTKMIGLITSDEVIYAGGTSINEEYYLYCIFPCYYYI